MYQCGCCASFSRFARYNHVGTTLYDTNRGRCGEYSVVALALVEALGYTARWIVDWADHLWIEVSHATFNHPPVDRGLSSPKLSVICEAPHHPTIRTCPLASKVLVQGRWVHLDPCEAAVDEPLLYESWGKNQTYIMGE